MSTQSDVASASGELPKTRDFARIADRYDDSRDLPPAILHESYERMESHAAAQ